MFTAQRVDFFAELRDGCWWAYLRVSALGQSLRYLVFVQKVGRGDTGILAVTPFAEILDDTPDNDRADATSGYRRAFVPTPRDSVTLVHSNTAEERWPEVAELIDRTLAAGLRYFVDQLS
ncbi:MAG TPA: hypothetical protein VFZ32_12320 [Micromonosporaceae bacterium]